MDHKYWKFTEWIRFADEEPEHGQEVVTIRKPPPLKHLAPPATVYKWDAGWRHDDHGLSFWMPLPPKPVDGYDE